MNEQEERTNAVDSIMKIYLIVLMLRMACIEKQSDGRSGVLPALDPDIPAVDIRDLLDERQTETVAFFFRIVLAEVPVEYVFQVLLVYSDTVILYGEFSLLRGYIDRAILGRVFDGVLYDIAYAYLHMRPIRFDERGTIRKHCMYLDVFLLAEGLLLFDDIQSDFLETQPFFFV